MFQSQTNPSRMFVTHGERLITCTECCGGELSGNGLHVEWMVIAGVNSDYPGNLTPACLESSAPHQGEENSYTTADEVAALESPGNYSLRRPAPRGCLQIAGRNSTVITEK